MTPFIVIAVGMVASIIDVRSRRVPNVLTFPLAAAGIWLAAAGLSGIELDAALLGLVVALLVMLPLHVLGGMGAGDVKLMAALGTLLGPIGVLNAILRMGIAGGVIAIAVAWQRGRLRTTLSGTALLLARADGATEAVESTAANNRFPYAPAIAIGATLVALGW
jgi:prepilin peptidase CpaA